VDILYGMAQFNQVFIKTKSTERTIVMTMKKTFLLSVLLCCIACPGFCQDKVQDGLTVWLSAFDDFNPTTGYQILQWTWSRTDNAWSVEKQIFMGPEIVGDTSYAGNVYDMGMDLITLPGSKQKSMIIAVSKGDGHFPSFGTEFQHRKLSADGVWDSVQEPLFTTPANVSPLGLDAYYEGDTLHIAWVEDNDEAGPKSLMCEIYDRTFTVNADGTLTASGDKKLVYSTKLNWSGSYPTAGGVAGLTVCDFDGDGDLDFIVGTAHYGDDPVKMAIRWIERLGPNSWATDFKNLWVGAPGHGAEGVRYANIDGDNVLDMIMSSGNAYAYSIIAWFEKDGDQMIEKDVLLDSNLEFELMEDAQRVGHIFGMYAEVPGATPVMDWSLQ